MKRLLFLFCVLVASSISVISCTVTDNDMGDKAAHKWNDFVQKNLVGDWVPMSIEFGPIIGSSIQTIPYPHNPNCTKDILVMRKDYSGAFNHQLSDCTLKQTKLTWKHRLGEVSFVTDNGRTVKSVPLHKDSKAMVLLFPALEFPELVNMIDPTGELITSEKIKLLTFKITYVKP
ncbi:MAG: hypothetical protein LBI72_03030 [Flavobacteriaceae bacterium]|jgi:hypothetical protein|nr:hypothetical protein [Flavobacteriaceae bacterium]